MSAPLTVICATTEKGTGTVRRGGGLRRLPAAVWLLVAALLEPGAVGLVREHDAPVLHHAHDRLLLPERLVRRDVGRVPPRVRLLPGGDDAVHRLLQVLERVADL